MNRRCSNKSKEAGEEEYALGQECTKSEIIATNNPIESSESDIHVEEMVVPLEGRGSMSLDN